MDPQACFKRLTDAIADGDMGEAYDAVEDLFNWLKKFGTAPVVPDNTYIIVGDGGPTTYAIHSRPNGWVRYQVLTDHALDGRAFIRDYPQSGGQRP